MSIKPERVVIIDIDGLRADVYQQALDNDLVPNMRRMTHTSNHLTACHVPVVSVAPSITFAAQASIYTGAHPGQHRVPGNESFDRLGHISAGKPRHFGFDVGDTLAVDDAIAVFEADLADRLLDPEVPTIYESAAQQSKTSLVAYNMYGRGAQTVIRPKIIDIARFTKSKGVLGLEAGGYDTGMLDRLIKELKRAQPRPDLITVYFMGLDHHSHLHGPQSQAKYLIEIVDPQIGRLLDTLEELRMFEDTLFAIVSDHGQIATPGGDAHSIRLGFPFDTELTPLFEALGLDLHDIPGEDPNVDAVVGLNGGLAQVYLRHQQDEWHVPPRYEEDVLRVAQAFHELTTEGRYRSELQNTLELILVRNAEQDGWQGEYQAYNGAGITRPFEEWLESHPELPYVDAVNRVRLASSSMSGDIILAAKAQDGIYFGGEGLKGVHGSLHADDSLAVLSFALPGAIQNEIGTLTEEVNNLINQRCESEGNRRPGIADMAFVLRSLWLE